MGLDGVELLMAVEEEFGIDIEEGDQIETVGDLYAYILAKIGCELRPTCPTTSAYLTLRRKLAGALGLPITAVALDSKLADLVGKAGRTRLLKDLKEPRIEACSTRTLLANLIEPLVTWVIFGLLCVGTITVAVFLLSLFPFWPEGIIGALRFALSAAAVALLFYYFVGIPVLDWYRKRRTLGRCMTVRDLLGFILGYKFSSREARTERWRSTEEWEKLRRIVSDWLEVDLALVTPDARFYEDLGMG